MMDKNVRQCRIGRHARQAILEKGMGSSSHKRELPSFADTICQQFLKTNLYANNTSFVSIPR